MMIYQDATGPLVEFDGQFLDISDLNPEQHMRWRMSRAEMLRLGFKAIWSALVTRNTGRIR